MLDDTHNDDDIARHARMSLVRSGLIQRIRLLRKYSGTYLGYSIACALVWAVILAAVYTQFGGGTRHTFAVFFGGWAIGWLSASIGRLVYPPPESRRPV
jgi:hypothetical protein